MRRSFVVVPLILFVLLIACVPEPGVTPLMGTSVALTQTASVITPSITYTPSNIYTLSIVNLLNSPLPEDGMLKRIEELENTIGAQYPVVDVKFPEINGVRVFQIEVHCQCAASVKCCNIERMFVEIMRKMQVYRDPIISNVSQVPGVVSEMRVYCKDHGEQLGIMTASWQDVKDFLNENISGSQLGSRVLRE
jgi:hypothetical protein